MNEPKPVSFSQTNAESYDGYKPWPLMIVGPLPGGLVEDPDDAGTYIIGAN